MEYDIALTPRGRWTWVWSVFHGNHCVATDMVPRFSEKSARRAAERAAMRHAQRAERDREQRYTVEFVPEEEGEHESVV